MRIQKNRRGLFVKISGITAAIAGIILFSLLLTGYISSMKGSGCIDESLKNQNRNILKTVESKKADNAPWKPNILSIFINQIIATQVSGKRAGLKSHLKRSFIMYIAYRLLSNNTNLDLLEVFI